MKQMIFLYIIITFFIFGCATKEIEEPEIKPVIEEIKELPKLPRVLLPIQSLYLIKIDQMQMDSQFIVLHFDRRDNYSALPQRLVLSPGEPKRLTPITTVGKKGLSEAEIIIIRNVRTRYALKEPEYSPQSFKIKEADTAEVPEFIVFVSALKTPVIIKRQDLKNKKNGIRSGLGDLIPEARERITGELSDEEIKTIELFLSQSRVFTDYEGIHSALILPFHTVDLPDYSQGITVSIDPGRGFDPSDWNTYTGFDMRFSQLEPDADKFTEITLGDMGVFSGGTVLLEPDLVTHTRKLISMKNVVRMPATTRYRSSPITIAGSFNIYRDERNRYLWYPGIISYIPGNHPDISDRDIQIIFDSSRHELEGLLLSTQKIYFGTQVLPGGLPLFFLAAPSARDLELAYERNDEVRAALREFLEQSAYTVRLF